MIFEKGRNTFVDIYFDGTKLELVASFKYIGLTFFKNGKWYRSQKIISQYGTFALHRLQCLFKNVFISIKEQIKLFDSLVASVLNYGSEVWGYDKCRDIDIVHNKFCRYVLCVKKSTNAGLPLVREKSGKFKVREKSGNLRFCQGILEFC